MRLRGVMEATPTACEAGLPDRSSEAVVNNPFFGIRSANPTLHGGWHFG